MKNGLKWIASTNQNQLLSNVFFYVRKRKGIHKGLCTYVDTETSHFQIISPLLPWTQQPCRADRLDHLSNFLPGNMLPPWLGLNPWLQGPHMMCVSRNKVTMWDQGGVLYSSCSQTSLYFQLGSDLYSSEMTFFFLFISIQTSVLSTYKQKQIFFSWCSGTRTENVLFTKIIVCFLDKRLGFGLGLGLTDIHSLFSH